MNGTTIKYYAGTVSVHRRMVYNKVIDKDKVTYPLNCLLFDESLVTKSSGGYSYEYHLKDHPSADGQVPPKVGQALLAATEA